MIPLEPGSPRFMCMSSFSDTGGAGTILRRIPSAVKTTCRFQKGDMTGPDPALGGDELWWLREAEVEAARDRRQGGQLAGDYRRPGRRG